jgi:hypothetical protein
VTVEPTELTVDPGREVATTVAVRNLGTRVEEFRLTPGGPAAGFAAITPTTLSIYPSDEQRAVVRFAPVRGPQSVAGVAPFEIMASSTIHPDVIDVDRGQVTVTPFQELRAVLLPEVSRGRTPSRLSRSSNVVAVEQTVDVGVEVGERVVAVAHLATQSSQHDRRPLMPNEFRDGLPGLGDDDSLAVCHALQQAGKMRLGLMDVDIDCHRPNLAQNRLSLVW